MSYRIGQNFFTCQNHRLIHCVPEIIAKLKDFIYVAQSLIKKLSYQISTANLRQVTAISAVKSNVTRWSSTYAMLRRFKELADIVTHIDDDEVQELLLSETDQKDTENICKIEGSGISHNPDPGIGDEFE